MALGMESPPIARDNIWSSLKTSIFVLGSSVVVFAAIRNSLTWHLQQFWGASGSFWQSLWDKVLDTLGEDTWLLHLFGPVVVTYAIYWSVGLVYIFMDVTNRPSALRRYKIQDGTNEPVSTRRLLEVIFWVHVNQTLVSIPHAFLASCLLHLRGFDSGRELPTFTWVLFELFILVLVEEFAFYYGHRLLHHRRLYRHIHKWHHEWTSPISVTAIYCHPVEHFFCNLTPPFLGVFIMGSHLATGWLWFSISILSTLNAHSGYHLPFLPSPEAHDYHHLKFTQCYGVLGILDRLHGTDEQFRKSRAYDRHIMLLSLVPITELYPDQVKGKARPKCDVTGPDEGMGKLLEM